MIERIAVKTDEPFDVYVSNGTGNTVLTIITSRSYDNVLLDYNTEKPIRRLFTNLTAPSKGLWCMIQDDFVSIKGNSGVRLSLDNKFESFQKEVIHNEVSCV